MPQVKKLTPLTLRKMVLSEKKKIAKAVAARRKKRMTLSESIRYVDALKTREAQLRSAARKIGRIRNKFNINGDQ